MALASRKERSNNLVNPTMQTYLYMVIARYYSDRQAPSRHALWDLELRVPYLLYEVLDLLLQFTVTCLASRETEHLVKEVRYT
jgi:hypothetical protein